EFDLDKNMARVGIGSTKKPLRGAEVIARVPLPKELRKEFFTVEPLTGGNYLIAAPGVGKIMELDRSGAVVWEKAALSGIAKRLRGGNTLATVRDGSLMEFDGKGKVVWEVSMPGGAQSVQPC